MDAPLSVSQFNRMVKQLVECEKLSDIVIALKNVEMTLKFRVDTVFFCNF